MAAPPPEFTTEKSKMFIERRALEVADAQSDIENLPPELRGVSASARIRGARSRWQRPGGARRNCWKKSAKKIARISPTHTRRSFVARKNGAAASSPSPQQNEKPLPREMWTPRAALDYLPPAVPAAGELKSGRYRRTCVSV